MSSLLGAPSEYAIAKARVKKPEQLSEFQEIYGAVVVANKSRVEPGMNW